MASAAVGAFFIAGAAFAQENSVTFPIPELGGCTSKEACKTYCEESANHEPCIAFAEAHNLMSAEEVAIARKIGNAKGPGGCVGLACKTYCGSEEHIDECLAFAEEHDIIPPEEVAIAKEVRTKGGPGGCKSEKECRAYCDGGGHFEECLAFAEKHNLIPKEELEMAKKMGDKSGPGGCRREACKTYCENPEHMDECLKFAEENGLMSSEDLERAKKFGNKPGPGGCRGRECESYCENPEHMDACIAFAEENGMMSKEEAERAKKFAGKPGPGGCVGEACRRYCDDAAHQDECFKFAVDNGLLSEEDQERMKEMRDFVGPGGCKGEECRTYCEVDDPGRQAECRAFAKENGIGLGRGGPQGEGMSGPGGCKTPDECRAYCESHQEECGGFRPGEGPDRPVGQERAMQQRGFEVPPGLMEECKENPEACREKFQQQGFPTGPMGAPDPAQFENMSEEERQKFMQEDRRMMDFRGAPPGEGKPYRPEGMMPPEAFRRPPEGQGMGPEFQQQYRDQYQREFDRQYQAEFEQRSQPARTDVQSGGQFMPPPGEYRPPQEGSFAPPPGSGGMMPPLNGGMMQPPPDGGTFQPPPPSDAPQANATSRFVASVLYIFASLFQL
ncbi:hypothetical protein A3B35_00385 [Candidatus Kaiserbacteria bacterium RIFCSPLOWO2_01_FULL_54_24]|uniref:Uncharacterized protein n=1 Tax=Candidatus Kaiserbacteria bacterium RIFCSPLOWO2_01_FULL_54_24 TaxID=1798515 RepID=A0A1F6ESQ5_9BACT|nr:MAG: hypothetical protein A3B35_00385 [Candidatus Kaiserbacteria bacterium RIFCSPLOWO2_01_FULL_54_24]